jgi:hypothetical protein
MTNRAMDILPRTVLAGMVASAAVTILQFHPASAADDCLTKPKGVAPSGQHWYYRSDHATKRQCWYLGDESSRGASLGVRKSAAVVAHRHHQLSQAAADARAEFPSPAVPATDVKRDLVAAAPAAMPAVPLAESNPAPAVAQDNAAAPVDQSAISSRWPEATNAVPPSAVTPPLRNASQFTMAAAETPSASVDSPAPTAAALPVSDTQAVDTPVAAPAPDSSRTQLAVFLGAVALIGFSTSVLLARARARRRIRLAPVTAQRRPRWPADPQIDPMQLPDVDRLHPARVRGEEAMSRRAAQPSIIPRDDARYDEQYEVEDLLARYSGQGRTSR